MLMSIGDDLHHFAEKVKDYEFPLEILIKDSNVGKLSVSIIDKLGRVVCCVEASDILVARSVVYYFQSIVSMLEIRMELATKGISVCPLESITAQMPLDMSSVVHMDSDDYIYAAISTNEGFIPMYRFNKPEEKTNPDETEG